MKQLTLLAFVLGIAQSVVAQVTVRNDFVINGKEHRIENRGITFISINLDHHANLNYLMSGRGGESIQVDMNALRYPQKRSYTYTQLAEKVFVPNIITGVVKPVPAFLLLGPPEPMPLKPILAGTRRLLF